MSVAQSSNSSGLARLIESRNFQFIIIGLIFLNAVILGVETAESAEPWMPALLQLHTALVWMFVIELVLRLWVHRLGFFRDPWNVFDFFVIGIALVPAGSTLSVLRALRVLRVLRLISMVPTMRRVVSALLAAVPGMGSIVVLLILVQYVAAVMATQLFAAVAPEFFGDLGKSWFTLFQIMTVEGWPDIARAVMAQMPYAWIFFVVYLLLSTFTVMNLFVGVIVNAMQEQLVVEEHEAHKAEVTRDETHHAEVLAQLKALRMEVQALRNR